MNSENNNDQFVIAPVHGVTHLMAIGVLISSPAEADRFTAFGLDLAARLNTSVAFLCVQPSEPDKPRLEKNKSDKPKVEKSKVEKAKTDSNGTSEPDNVAQFIVVNSFIDETREHVVKHIGSMAFGFIPNEVFEVPHKLDELRKWVCETHQSSRLGYFDIETLFIPMLRGAGLEHAREEKDHLFEISQLETVYLQVDQSQTDRLPLNNIGVTGQNDRDILKASQFARRISNARITRENKEQRDPNQSCVVAALHGKANQTRIDNSATWKTLRKDPSLPVAMMLNPADAMHDRFATAVDDKIRYLFADYQLSRGDRVRLSEKLENGAASSPEFILFMSVATFLACIGLIQDSAAVIIGAMLVAPLMTPLLGAGLALIFGNRPLFGKAVRSILLGVGIAFLIGTLVGLFSFVVPTYLLSGNGLCLTNEMISRSQPNILDPFIGLAAGLAGGFAIGRDGTIGTVAGVAIAAALVPPIATAGLEAALAIYCAIAEGDPMIFFQLLKQDPGEILSNNGLINSAPKSTAQVHLITAPLVLFALNACATIIGAFIGLRMVGMHRTSRSRQSRTWVFVFLLLLLAAIVALMLFPLINV